MLVQGVVGPERVAVINDHFVPAVLGRVAMLTVLRHGGKSLRSLRMATAPSSLTGSSATFFHGPICLRCYRLQAEACGEPFLAGTKRSCEPPRAATPVVLSNDWYKDVYTQGSSPLHWTLSRCGLNCDELARRARLQIRVPRVISAFHHANLKPSERRRTFKRRVTTFGDNPNLRRRRALRHAVELPWLCPSFRSERASVYFRDQREAAGRAGCVVLQYAGDIPHRLEPSFVIARVIFWFRFE